MASEYELDELSRESRMGALGSETSHRQLRQIDLTDYTRRRAQIREEIWEASLDTGFFQLVNHGVDAETLAEAFALTAAFFALPDEVKAAYPFDRPNNAGWESRSQVRPSTRSADAKESYQITRSHMDGLWPPDSVLPGFRERLLLLESTCWQVAMRVLSCFADKLGFPLDFFTLAHDPASPTYQSTLRLLHYYPVDLTNAGAEHEWRAGAHTDYDCLTLLFQQEGQGGLQVLPGSEADTNAWTPVPPLGDVITCNIGDMLMRWSDDLLPSNFHRVKAPLGERVGDRYSIAYFAQANRDVVISGPQHRYAPITAEDYLKQRVAANFAAM
jgi:isopenicillin N synthase-like dioxygenase